MNVTRDKKIEKGKSLDDSISKLTLNLYASQRFKLSIFH